MAKGISDLMATVLLISIIVAIAIVMSGWSKFFSEEKLGTSSAGVECIGAIDLGPPLFVNTSINATISNVNNKISLNRIKAIVTYENSAEKTFSLNITNDTLKPGDKINLIIETNDTAKPKKIEVFAANCRDATAYMNFK